VQDYESVNQEDDYLTSIMRIMQSIREHEEKAILFENPFLSHGKFASKCEEILHNGKVLNQLVESHKGPNVPSIYQQDYHTLPANDNLRNEINSNDKDLLSQHSITSKPSVGAEIGSFRLLSGKREREEKSSSRKTSLSVRDMNKEEGNEMPLMAKHSSSKKPKAKEENVYFKIYKKRKENKLNLEFSDEELKLVNMVNKPRSRTTTKKSSSVSSQQDEEAKLKELYPEYEEIISEMKKDKYHRFMIENFPDHYQIKLFMENYNIKCKRLSNIRHLIHTIKFDVDPLFSNKGKKDLNIKKVWTSENNEKTDNFLKEVQEIWPYDVCRFSEDITLRMLMTNNFDFESTKRMIENQEIMGKHQ